MKKNARNLENYKARLNWTPKEREGREESGKRGKRGERGGFGNKRIISSSHPASRPHS